MDTERGQDLIEYGLVLPFFILLALGVMEFGFLFFQYSSLTNVAREAARVGLLPITTSCSLACRTAAAEAAGQVFADAAGLEGIDIDASASTALVSRVTVTFDTELLTHPMVEAVGGTGTITLNTTATMNRE
jgi:Flp pilus assembly protein TadG